MQYLPSHQHHQHYHVIIALITPALRFDVARELYYVKRGGYAYPKLETDFASSGVVWQKKFTFEALKDFYLRVNEVLFKDRRFPQVAGHNRVDMLHGVAEAGQQNAGWYPTNEDLEAVRVYQSGEDRSSVAAKFGTLLFNGLLGA